MDSMTVLERYARFLVRHAWTVLALVAIATAAVAFGMTKLRAEFNVEASLPDNHPFVQIDREIRQEFGGRKTIIAAIVPREGDVWRPEVLEVVQDFTLEALRLPDIIAQNVVSLAAPAVRHVEEVEGEIKVDYVMRDVPRTPDEMATLRTRVEGNKQLRGMLVTDDQRAALVVVDFWPSDSVQSHDLARTVMRLADKYRDRPLDIYFAGEPMITLMDEEQSREIGWRIPITFAVIAAMLLISFRNLQGMLIPMLTATLSTIWALGLMGHTGIMVDGWNAAVPILLIAVAAAHSAQMLKRYVEEVARTGDNEAAVIESTAKIGVVMLAAGLTAALGFASLALFGVRSVANLGLSCAYGILSAVLLEMTFIPALRAVLPAPRRVPPEHGATQRMLDAFHRGIMRDRGRPVLIGTAVTLVLAVIGIARIRTFGSTREYMPPDTVSRIHLEKIEEHFPGTVTMTILYEGEAGSTKTLPVLQHMAGLQDELERNPLVLRTASLADLVKELHKTFRSDDPNPYRLPDDQELTSQLMFLGESPAFERFTNRAQDKAVVIAYLRDDDSAQVGPLLRHAEQWLRTHQPPEGVKVLIAGGAGPTVLAVNEHTTYGKLLNMVVVLVVIYAVASAILRSPRAGLFVVSPIALTIVQLFGLLGWAGMKLDMGTASVIAMAAGVGADYAIYFLFRLREERARYRDDDRALGAALHTSGRAVVFVAAAIAAGFSVLGFSKFLGLRIFGQLMPTAMVLACLASISVMPVLVLRVRPKFIFGADAARVVPDPSLEPVA